MIPVVDLFAGPGGLGEGFSAATDGRGRGLFCVRLSVEENEDAHRTLLLRSFYRQFDPGGVPEDYYRHLRGELSREDLFDRHGWASRNAQREARKATLGKAAASLRDEWISQATRGSDAWVLLGGPPCQAYSVAGRSRNKGVGSYTPEADGRHFLYREYLTIIARHWPAVFVFENVKGVLSSRVHEGNIFEQIFEDLVDPGKAIRQAKWRGRHGYCLWSVSCRQQSTEGPSPADFVVRSELHGIPQARHRVFIIGIRDDLPGGAFPVLRESPAVSTYSVIGSLPAIRSMLPRALDSDSAWLEAVRGFRPLLPRLSRERAADTARTVESVLDSLAVPAHGTGAAFIPGRSVPQALASWLVDPRLGGTCNHESRNHMADDLRRYLFASSFALANGRSAKLRDFPRELLPNHRNVGKALLGGFFQDRFRVQLHGEPATTITSHLAKDGHHFIHPDPRQCRSLTVREAARLQTFPDNYLFCGQRTAQYVQVGNAVPPLLARQIAELVWAILDSVDRRESHGPVERSAS